MSSFTEAVPVAIHDDGLSFVSERTPVTAMSQEERQITPTNLWDNGYRYSAWWSYRPLTDVDTTVDFRPSKVEVPYTAGFNLYYASHLGPTDPFYRPRLSDLNFFAGTYSYAVVNSLIVGRQCFIQAVTTHPNNVMQCVLTGAKSDRSGSQPDPQPPPPATPPPPANPHPPPVIPDPGQPPDPGVITPPVTEAGSATIIDLIRAFSSEVRWPVRLVNPTTIVMVDLDAALPAGFTTTDAESMYCASSVKAEAGAVVLSTLDGHMAVSTTTQLVSDDVRLAVSNWAGPPDRLPIPSLGSGYVQRYSYDFSPGGFTGDIEFQVIPTPLIVRGE